MQIRRALFDDLAAITDIYNEAVLTTTATFDTEVQTVQERHAWLEGHDELHPVIVVEVDHKVAAWGSLSAWSQRAAYNGTVESSLYVKAEYQGMGCGKALQDALIQMAKENGHRILLAQVTTENKISIALHEKTGFRTVGILEQVGRKFGRLLDVAIMQRML